MQIEELKDYKFEQKGDCFVFGDIPNSVYHAGPGLSSSYIRSFGRSQLHAVEHVQETTPAMNFGTAAHALLVEGEDEFNNTVAVIAGSPYTKAKVKTNMKTAKALRKPRRVKMNLTIPLR